MRPWLALLAACTPEGRFIIEDPRVTLWSPVVVREVPLSPTPGALPLGVWLEPGFALPATVASWLPVHVDHPVAIDGWVPSSARGMSTEAPPSRDRADVRLQPSILVYDAPTTDGEVVALFDEGALGVPGEPGAWVAIDTIVERIRVSGWVVVPEVQLTRPNVRVFDFSDDVIDGDLAEPDGIRD